MFVSPSKIIPYRIFRNRTLTFETVQPIRGNMVFVPTDSKGALVKTIKGKLFRPTQMMCLYTPRRVKPVGRSMIIVDQKTYYADIKSQTNNKIKIGKTLISAYSGRNIIYDIYNDYKANRDAFIARRKGVLLQKTMTEYLESVISTAADDNDYEDFYLIFPMDKYIDNMKRMIEVDLKTIDPLVLFLKSIVKSTINIEAFSKIKRVIFYNPNAEALIAVDLKDPELEKNLPTLLLRLYRLNNFNKGDGSELLDDEEFIDPGEQSEEDVLENKKEELKNLVFKKVAKTIRADNLTDFETATYEEQELMQAIDKKVETYLNKDSENKTFADMVSDVEKDQDIKTKAIKYVETKKAAAQKLDVMSKAIDKEAEVIGSLQDLDVEGDENTADTFKIHEDDIDDRIEVSHLSSFDEEYTKKKGMTDLSNIISSFSNSEFSPMAVDNVNIVDSSNYADMKKTLNVRYKTDDGKTLSFQLDIPDIVDKRHLYIGGNKKVIKKQLIRLPIVKIKSNWVDITTNYNKMTVVRTSGKISRKNEYLLKKLKETTNNPAFSIEYGDSTKTNADRILYSNDFEYEELAGNIVRITTPKYLVLFNRELMADELAVLDIPEDFIGRNKTPLAFEKVGDTYKALIFILDRKIYRYDLTTHLISDLNSSLFEFLTKEVLKLDMSQLPKIGNKFMYTQVKFLQTTYPVLTVVASQVGLTNILRRYNVEYYTSAKAVKNIEFVEVKFKDKFLYYRDTPRNSLLLDALYVMGTEHYNFDQFDTEEPYTAYFVKILGPTIGVYTRNTLKISLNVMIDPISHDILNDMKLPTNIIDLLLYANTLLVGNQYKHQGDLTSYRVRSNEIVNARLYKILADAYVNYQRHKMNGRPTNLIVPKGELIKELLMDNNVQDKSTLNPVIECEEIAKASPKGMSGININDAYRMEIRAYDKTMNGFLSGNATPYSGEAGITRSLTYDPKISSVRGYIPLIDQNNLSATNILSPTELLASFTASQADAPRAAMQVAQTGHSLPILHPSKQLVGTGMNKTLAYLISDDFAFKAKKSGIVEKIDNKNNLAILRYDDGTGDAIDLSDKLNKNSGMGFYIHQNFRLVYAEGEHFDAGDVLAYNPSYFSGKGKDVDYQPGALAKVAIAAGDFSFEDSTMISEKLSGKCAAKINMLKQVVLGKNATVYGMVNIGDKVLAGDALMDFTSSFNDPDTSEFLANLAKQLDQDSYDEITHEKITAKYSGEITDIKIFYNCPFEELSPSLQEIVKNFKKRISERQKALGGIKTSSVNIPPLEQVNVKKIDKEEFPQEGGVIINIYVEYIDEMSEGDKLTYSTALKRGHFKGAERRRSSDI